jgi:hypothetical protein
MRNTSSAEFIRYWCMLVSTNRPNSSECGMAKTMAAPLQAAPPPPLPPAPFCHA